MNNIDSLTYRELQSMVKKINKIIDSDNKIKVKKIKLNSTKSSLKLYINDNAYLLSSSRLGSATLNIMDLPDDIRGMIVNINDVSNKTLKNEIIELDREIQNLQDTHRSSRSGSSPREKNRLIRIKINNTKKALANKIKNYRRLQLRRDTTRKLLKINNSSKSNSFITNINNLSQKHGLKFL